MTGTGKSCPCGSGKPYKKCCGGEKTFFSLDQARWRRAGHELRRRLGEFADQPSFAWDAARAQDLYLGCMDRQLVNRDDDFTMERCFEWFIFDYRLTGGKTIIETFQDEHPPGISDQEVALIKEWSRSRISLYEVTGVIPDEGLYIKDLLGRKKIKVRDVNAAKEIIAGSVLLMRVLNVGEEYEFSTSGLALLREYRDPILKRLHRDRAEYLKERRNRSGGWDGYLKERAHKINAWVLELCVSSSRRGKESEEKEGTERRAILAVINWDEALKIVNRLPSLRVIRQLKDNDGVLRQVTAAVFGEPNVPQADGETKPELVKPRAGSAGSGKNFLRPVRGQVLLTQRLAIVAANTPGLLRECKKLLLELFEGAIADVPVQMQADEGEPGVPAESLAVGQGVKQDSEKEGFTWPEPGYAAVAGSVSDGLESLGYSQKQQKCALKLWFDYCSKERPSIRKTAVWAATVIYAFTRLEMENRPKQQELAWSYGVASSTISSKFRMLCESLKLVAYDRRYSTKRPGN